MQQELYMLKLASDQGLSPTKDEAWNFLCAMDDEDEFGDIELDAVALAAVAGGWSRTRGC